MRIETAVYGEVNGGHALRAASSDVDFAKAIAGRLDLPSNPPIGVSWSPAISGFPAQGRYVIARTFLDSSAARGNMVLAHALIMPIEDIQHFVSLPRLLERLATHSDQIPKPSALEVEDGGEIPEADDLAGLAALLVASEKKAGSEAR